MQYREFGTTGIKVSYLGFGAMRLPMAGSEVDYDASTEIMHRAFERGVNYVDSAYVYLNEKSEIAVGRALKSWPDKIFVSTKNHYKGRSGIGWHKLLDTSLRRLGVDCIDFYHFHDLKLREFEDDMSVKGGPVQEAQRALNEGMISCLSYSSHDTPENIVKIARSGIFSSVLCQYNILDRRNEEAMHQIHDRGLGVAVMGPVGGGRLVGYSEQVGRLLPGDKVSTPQMALRFVISNPSVDIALSGMSTINMVEENVQAASYEIPLGPGEREKILQTVEDLRGLSDLPCTECGYCMPCPHGVNIPRNFMLFNLNRVFGLTHNASKFYMELNSEWLGKKASECVECGECLSKCPQNINIPERLKDVVKLFE